MSRHGDLHDQGDFTLDDFVVFARRGYCLVCETTIRDDECVCTGFHGEDCDD